MSNPYSQYSEWCVRFAIEIKMDRNGNQNGHIPSIWFIIGIGMGFEYYVRVWIRFYKIKAS